MPDLVEGVSRGMKMSNSGTNIDDVTYTPKQQDALNKVLRLDQLDQPMSKSLHFFNSELKSVSIETAMVMTSFGR